MHHVMKARDVRVDADGIFITFAHVIRVLHVHLLGKAFPRDNPAIHVLPDSTVLVLCLQPLPHVIEERVIDRVGVIQPCRSATDKQEVINCKIDALRLEPIQVPHRVRDMPWVRVRVSRSPWPMVRRDKAIPATDLVSIPVDRQVDVGFG